MTVWNKTLVSAAMLLSANLVTGATIPVANAVTNIDAVVSGELTYTGAGGIQMKSLRLQSDARLTLDPVRTPIYVTSGAPTFEAGARIALDGAYSTYANGRMALLTWAGTSRATLPEGLFDAASAPAASAPLVFQESYTNSLNGVKVYTRLLLDLNPAAVKPRLRITAIGDSITDGSSTVGFGSPNYRVYLMKKLAARGWDVTSHGYRNNAVDAAGMTAPEEWAWHAGLGGMKLIPTVGKATRGGFREGIENVLESAGRPGPGEQDVILFFIGANDANTAYDMDIMYESWTNVMWRICRARPTSKILAAPCLDFSSYTDTNGWRKRFIARIRAAIGDGHNEPGFPENQVHYVHLTESCPRWDDHGVENPYFWIPGNQHPNWVGHDRISTYWANCVEQALAMPPVKNGQGGDAVFTPNNATGAISNVPDVYRGRFTHMATLDLKAVMDTGAHKLVKGALAPYSFLKEDIGPAERFAKVGYYLELRHKFTGHVRWVWADMDTWGDRTFASFEFPLAYTAQRTVAALHVVSNDGGIETVEPNDDSVAGFIQFTPGNFTTNQASAGVGAPEKSFCWDWNLTLDEAGAFGLMQLYRCNPGGPRPHFAAETLFSYNRWCGASSHEVTLGDNNTVSHDSINGNGTVNNAHLNLAAYDLATLEIWAEENPVPIAGTCAAGWDFTNVIASVTVKSVADGHAADRVRLALFDECTREQVATETRAFSGTGDYGFALPGSLVAGRAYRYEIAVVDAAGEPIAGTIPVEGRFTLAASETPVVWFGEENHVVPCSIATPAKPARLGPVSTVEHYVEFEGATLDSVLAEDDLSDKQCALAVGQGRVWKAAVGGKWTTMEGPEPVDGRYAVRFELDYSTSPGKVRYSVKPEAADAFTPLTHNGCEWLENPIPAATSFNEILYAGDGAMNAVTGTAADVGVAAAGGAIYATLAEAAAAAGTGGTVTLRTNSTFDPGAVAAGGYSIASEGFALLWKDTANYVVYDEDSGALEVKSLGSAATPPNGMDSYASHLLGLDPEDPDSRPKAAITANDEGEFTISATNLNPIAGARVNYQLESAGALDFAESEKSPAQASPVFKVNAGSATAGFFRVIVNVE